MRLAFERNPVYLTLLLIFLLFFAAYFCFPTKKSSIHWGKFEGSDLQLAVYDLDDLGVADVNNDSNLDIFTTNHSARQSILLGDGKGKFEDSLDVLRLGQDQSIPGLEDSEHPPEFMDPGYYIYRQSRWLFIVAHRADDLEQLQGSLEVPWPLEIVKRTNSDIDFLSKKSQNSSLPTLLKFAIREKGLLKLIGVNDIVELPHTFNIESNFDLRNIFLGHKRVNPTNHQFTLHWRDRHSMSWADVDDNGLIDVFIGRGGVKGGIRGVSAQIADELFINEGKYFKDGYAEFGLNKGNCPGRQSAWTDFDDDGKLDLYISCGRFGFNEFPNLLFRRQDSNQFSESGTKVGLDFGAETGFVWVDSDNDSDLDLLLMDGQQLLHFRNSAGILSPEVVSDSFSSKGFVKFSIADFDQDGDADVLLVSRQASWLLQNEDGVFEKTDPSKIGLPVIMYSAEWVDFDNDGFVDLHAIPGGIYSKSSEKRFEATNLLDFAVDFARISAARCSWFDSNNDGTREPVCAVQSYPNKIGRVLHKLFRKNDYVWFWKYYFSKNLHKDNHWLQLDLVGPDGNRQAIGSRVVVSTASGKQTQRPGQNDGSVLSQGHYRLYFGLGTHEIVRSVAVTWPDGKTLNLTDVSSDQLLSIRYE